MCPGWTEILFRELIDSGYGGARPDRHRPRDRRRARAPLGLGLAGDQRGGDHDGRGERVRGAGDGQRLPPARTAQADAAPGGRAGRRGAARAPAGHRPALPRRRRPRRPHGLARDRAAAARAARRDAAGRPAAGRHKVRVPSGVGPARRPHRGVQRARLPDRPRERVAGARAPRSPGARAGDRPDARGMGVRASRHRPGWRDAAGERRAELPDREAHRRGPLPAPVPGSPVSPLAAAPRLLVVGSANVDFTVAARHLPRPGETVSGGTLLVSHGGKGANQAVAARRLGAEVRFLACVGDDGPGREIRAALDREGIGITGVRTTDRAATGTALILVDAEGRNAIAVAPGANRELTVEMVQPPLDDLAGADAVVCQLETPPATVAWVLGEARRRGRLTLLNPAPMRDEARDLVALADYLTPNETEAERLSGIAVRDPASAAAAARALRTRGASTVIVTLGAQGALACTA